MFYLNSKTYYKKRMSSFYSKIIIIVITLLLNSIVRCTIDVNMTEMKYLADHLQPEECRRLVAALHYNSYNQPNALDAAEDKVSEDIPCLSLLLHWNSTPDEGRGQTHEMLFRRLRQIGRDDLAEWLGKTVFHELGEDFERSLNDPFQEFIAETTESFREHNTTTIVLKQSEYNSDWLPFDTISTLLIFILIVSTTALLARSIYFYCRKNRTNKPRTRKYGEYNEIETKAIISESESEDKFDIRKKDELAFTLMGV